MSADENLVPLFVPALSAVLLAAEDKKGEPLAHDEVRLGMVQRQLISLHERLHPANA